MTQITKNKIVQSNLKTGSISGGVFVDDIWQMAPMCMPTNTSSPGSHSSAFQMKSVYLINMSTLIFTYILLPVFKCQSHDAQKASWLQSWSIFFIYFTMDCHVPPKLILPVDGKPGHRCNTWFPEPSNHHSKWHLDRVSHFFRIHGCDEQTNKTARLIHTTHLY